MFCEPNTLMSIHSFGFFSAKSTYLVAAVCITISGLYFVKQSLTLSILVTSNGVFSQLVSSEAC